jgi:crotonobetainyl-CoA:carnitine CoA-transferase CaiB-like acyl-CoA transferase
MTPESPPRSLPFNAHIKVGLSATNRSTHYAVEWLNLLGNPPQANTNDAAIIITAGDPKRDVAEDYLKAGAVIRLWDYQVGHAGTGVHASAVSGAASAIGHPSGPGVPLPVDMPEKWCGAHGVILALAEVWRRLDDGNQKRVLYDVSAADIMRAFSLQNAGDTEETATRWRRNGRICVEHGGIFPMGFYPCRDGFVALLGRSRQDWKNIRAAIGNPEWSKDPAYDDPFLLAKDSARADILLEETLAGFGRDELLARGLEAGAVIAPVYDQREAAEREIFRPGFIDDGAPAMPFVVHRAEAKGAAHPTKHRQPPIDIPQAPLSGLRCLELCWVWSGPMVAQILADLGAEVIKVEAPNRFDLYRTRGLEPLRGKMHEKTRIESSIYFHSLNRNKLGLSLDLKNPAALDAMKDLIGTSDLLIENFTVGTMERLGLGPEAMEAANPALVQLSMSGPGRGSSVEDLRSYGLVLSALGGAEATITNADGFLGSPTFSISDPNAAVFGVMAALAGALGARGGAGGSIDLSQIEAAATLAGTPTPAADRHEAIVTTSDGAHVAISVPLAAFANLPSAEQEFRHLDRSELFTRCTMLGGEATGLVELDVSDDAPIFANCPAWVAASHPYTGDEKLVGAPWRINGARPSPRKPAPLMGESNDYVLRGILGMDDQQIAALTDTSETLS